jgi:hypothetical protein
MRMFERYFRNYKLDFTLCEGLNIYTDKITYMMWIGYVAGYNKGKVKNL